MVGNSFTYRSIFLSSRRADERTNKMQRYERLAEIWAGLENPSAEGLREAARAAGVEADMGDVVQNAVQSGLTKLAKRLGYPGSAKLYAAAVREDVPATRKDVDAFVRHNAARQVFARRPKYEGKIVARDVDDRWAADLIDYSKRTSKREDGAPYMYVLIVQDIFSRKLYARAMVEKTPQTTADAFESIVREHGKAPRRLDTDGGAEFTAAPFQEYLQEEDIMHVRKDLRDTNATGTLDAAIRNVREQLARIMASENVRAWHTVLKRAIDAYNDTVHSHLHGRTPDDLPEDDVLRFRLQAEASNDQGKNEAIIKRREAALKRNGAFRNELVPEKHMKRAYEPRWSDQKYEVARVLGGRVYAKDGASFPTRHVLPVPKRTGDISTAGLRGGSEAENRRAELEPFRAQLEALITAPMALTRAALEMDKIPFLKAKLTRGMTYRRALDLLGFETTDRMVGPKRADGAAPMGNFQAEDTRRQRAALEPYRARIAAFLTERTSLKVAALRMKNAGLTPAVLKAQRLGNYANVLSVLGYRVTATQASPQ
jgi:hypothetical protein